MPEFITFDPSQTITETSTGPSRTYAPHVDHNNDAADAVDGLRDVANRFRLDAIGSLKQLPQPLQTWETLDTKVATADREIRTAAEAMTAASRDLMLPPEGRMARWSEQRQKAKAQLDNLDADGQALLKIAHAELRAGAMPTITEGREAFARDEIAAILDATPASDQFTAMVEIARGADRDQAAVVIGPLGKALLRKHSTPGRDLDRNAEALTNAALSGSETHGTPEQKAYAKAFREALPAMQKYHTTQVAYSRHKFIQAERGR